MKKFPVLLSVAAMLAGLCACSGPAASSGDNGSSPAPETDITFPLAESRTYSMFTIMNNDVALNDVMGFKKLEEMTNVHWEIQSVLPAELAEKQSLLLGSGQYPDVFFRSSLDEATLNKYGKNGTFIPLNNLIEKYAPNLKKELDTRLSARDKLTSADGNIYSLPLLGRDGPGGWINCFINQPWLTKLGLEMPTTLDEFYTTLKAFKTGDPNGSESADEIPFICTQDFLYYFLPNFGIEVDPNSGACNMAIIDGKYQHIYSSERYKEFLAYMTKLYSEGLLDKNTFIQDGEQIHAIGASGDTIGFFFDLASYLTVGRERDADFVRVPVFAEHVLPYATSIGVGAMAITDKCKNPEIVMSWADQFYTQEGGALSFMGVEGESYKKKMCIRDRCGTHLSAAVRGGCRLHGHGPYLSSVAFESGPAAGEKRLRSLSAAGRYNMRRPLDGIVFGAAGGPAGAYDHLRTGGGNGPSAKRRRHLWTIPAAGRMVQWRTWSEMGGENPNGERTWGRCRAEVSRGA